MTFLFDIGNVLLKLHFENYRAKVLGDANTPLPDKLGILKDPYETGHISDNEFVTKSLQILKSNLSPQDYTEAWQDIFSPNVPMWEVVEKLQTDGHRLILFSNTNALHSTFFLEKYEVFQHFPHHHFSQEVGAIKPHDDFYQKAVDTYDLIPAETAYLDDLPENITTGKAFGFQSWQYDFNAHASCLDWLKSLGV
ncbi:MAG: HAD-IA family hydrolase [Akkermansiaceae bacterium]|nr:HAD-IA family hydrolase [Akkermansiaceae bacterium]